MNWKQWSQLIAALIVAAICVYIGKLVLPVVQTMTPAIGWTLSVVVIIILGSIGLGVPAAIFIGLKSLHTHHAVKEIEARKLVVTERGFIGGYISRREQILVPQITAHSVEVPGHVHIQEEHSSTSGGYGAADWRERLAYEKLALDKEKLRLLSAPSAVAPDVPGPCTFSQTLTTFRPSAEQIILGYLPGNTPALATAGGLCHVALAGATGGGKSVLIRLIIAQLCYAGADVLLLNPHFTRYDIESGEDWTPFEPYLYEDPMRCRDYGIIEEYLREVAEVLLPQRLQKYAHSQPIGKPFYIVLDELPAIVKHVPAAAGYIADLLREGRKVGLFLVTAAQDFLVKTVMGKDGTGAVRDCFRTAIYVGGDPTTARVLLDVKGGVDDGQLGKGVVMLRGGQTKQAQFARVPYCDNEALYRLLGPSTYVPIPADDPLTPGRSPEMRRPWNTAERHDADEAVVDADPPEMEPLMERPTNVTTFPKTGGIKPVEPTSVTSEERQSQQKYILSDTEITAFLAAYRACRNRDKALAAIGKGSSNYRECANRILLAYGLREEA